MSNEQSRLLGEELQQLGEENLAPSDSSRELPAHGPPEGLESEAFGDEIIYKQDDMMRIGFLNINGIPQSNDDIKNINTKAAIDICDLDHVGFAEVNHQWAAIDIDHQWQERIKPWWEHSKSIEAYNHKDIHNNPFQPGGVITSQWGIWPIEHDTQEWTSY